MNPDRDLDRLLDQWFADGPTEVADRVVGQVADRIEQQPQRSAWRLRRRSPMRPAITYGLAAAAVLVVAVVGYNLLPRQFGVGNPSNTPSTPLPTVTSTSTPGATQAANPLVGSWTSGIASCADQNAALQRAGYTAEQLALGGWDAKTCSLPYGIGFFRIQFRGQAPGPVPSGTSPGGMLSVSPINGSKGWQGRYVMVDADTFMFGYSTNVPSYRYQFTIDGDQLVIDWVDDQLPAPTDADVWDGIIERTVTFESGPFTRAP